MDAKEERVIGMHETLLDILSTLRSQQKEGISSVEIKEDAKGQPHLVVKAYHPDVHMAAARATETYRRLRDELSNPDLRPALQASIDQAREGNGG